MHIANRRSREHLQRLLGVHSQRWELSFRNTPPEISKQKRVKKKKKGARTSGGGGEEADVVDRGARAESRERGSRSGRKGGRGRGGGGALRSSGGMGLRGAAAAVVVGAVALAAGARSHKTRKCTATIAGEAATMPELSVLVDVVNQAAGVPSPLFDAELFLEPAVEVTAFAPMNAAFARRPFDGMADDIFGHGIDIAPVLMFHVVPETMEPDQAYDTAAGPDAGQITISEERDTVQGPCNSANVTLTVALPRGGPRGNVEVCASVLHIVDAVLLPASFCEGEHATASAADNKDEDDGSKLQSEAELRAAGLPSAGRRAAELETKLQGELKIAAEEIKALEEKIAELQEEQSEGGAEVFKAELQGALEAQKELATRVAELESEQAASEEELEKKLREAADEKETLAAQAQAYHAELEAKWQLDTKVAAEGHSEEIKALEEKIAELQEERTDGFSSAIGAGWDADDADDAEGEVQSLKAELEAALRENERCVDELQERPDSFGSAVGAGCPDADDAEDEARSLKRELRQALVENRRCEDDFLAAASSEEKQNRRIAALLAEQEDLRRELDRISADVMQPASRPKFPL